MNSLLGFIRWAAIGSLALGGPVGFGLWAYCHINPGSSGHDIEDMITIAAGFLLGAVGCVLGGIYGVVRARKIPLLPVVGWAMMGALLAGILAPTIIILVTHWKGSSQVLVNGGFGAAFGFVLGSMYGINRTSRQLPTHRSAKHIP
jgi:hypothetical protein